MRRRAEDERVATIRRANEVAEDLSEGVNALAVLHAAAAGLPNLDRRLRRLERALVSVRDGDVWSSIAVDERLLRIVDQVRARIPVWQRTGRGGKELRADAGRLLRRLTRLPPRKEELCSLCQERVPFMGGLLGGGICAVCIELAHDALVTSRRS
jgi:hypothetical protein